MSIADEYDQNEAWDRAHPPTVGRAGPRWGRVAVHVMRDHDLSMPARAMYALLATYADDSGRDCVPSTKSLTEQTGATKSGVLKWVRELESAGLVEVVPRYRPDGGQTSNSYVLLDALGGQHQRGRGSTPVGGGGTPARTPKRNTTSPNTTTEQEPPSPPLGEETDEQPPLLDLTDEPTAGGDPVGAVALVPVETPSSEEFDAFWAAYPRKVGKGAARKAWDKARRKASVEEIAAGFRVALPGWQQRKARGEERFIPHPSTWLNEERWHDDAPQAERVTSAPAGSVSMLVQQAANAAEGRYVDPWEYARGVDGSAHLGLDSRTPGHPALPANERNTR